MSKKSSGEKDKSDTDRSLFGKLVDGVIVFCICVFAIKVAIETLICIRVPLIVIGVTAVIIVIIYRNWKWRRDRDDY
ncbi:hypothetical protein [Congzhengia minquanensis]|uniref:Uncharacterized protein n=1 Tax=Congzhengia minquanensis TaxID=2763657 RepID=A0A926DMR6_9FIRM|nr:hypothetical protein [Congzhengia minquanensis]MBC8540074.1 hypothetical protein [Congzhengia minquanensis]